MDVRWLQDFLALTETGNFTRAAELRHASQPAFSRRIQGLEAWLGANLVDRGVFPTRLTPEGERFRVEAAELVGRIAEVRAELSGRRDAPGEPIRIAIPYALATTRLVGWWPRWTEQHRLSATLISGNVHDLAAALVSGAADLLIGFQAAVQPLQLDPARYARRDLGGETLRPYAAPSLLADPSFVWPGRPDRPAPLLAYSRGVYFDHLVAALIDAAPTPLCARTVVTNDLADVLAAMARAGHGVAFLTEATAGAAGGLAPASGADWSLPLRLAAWRDRANDRPALARLWAALAEGEQETLINRTGG